MIHSTILRPISERTRLPEIRPGTSVAYVGQMVQSQAAILAYIDVFFALAVVAGVMVPLSFSLRSVSRVAAGAQAL